MDSDNDLLIRKPALVDELAAIAARRVRDVMREQLNFAKFPVRLYDGQGNRIDFYRGDELVGSIMNIARPSPV